MINEVVNLGNTYYNYNYKNTELVKRTYRFSNDFFERWINFLDVSKGTINTYTKSIRQFLLFLQNNRVTQPTRETVIAFREYSKLHLKPTTVQCYLMAVRNFFRWTEEEGLYPDVAKNVRGLKIDYGFKKDYLTPSQVRYMLHRINRSTVTGVRNYAIILLMVTTGIRTIEVQRANIEDIRNVADFTALFVQGKGHDDKNEYVKLEKPVLDAINEYLTYRSDLRGSSPLFADAYKVKESMNRRLTTRMISKIAKDCMYEAGIDGDRFCAHSLRHTTATLNLLNGGTVQETKQLLRHARLDTTLIYCHNLERAKNNSEARVTQAILGRYKVEDF